MHLFGAQLSTMDLLTCHYIRCFPIQPRALVSDVPVQFSNGCINSEFDQYGDMKVSSAILPSVIVFMNVNLPSWPNCPPFHALSLHPYSCTQATVDGMAVWATATRQSNSGIINVLVARQVTGSDTFSALCL